MKFVRNLKQGALEIDGEKIMDGDGLSSGSARSLNVKPPYYMGGMPEEVGKIAAKNLKVSLLCLFYLIM